jgi:hypothetical protein
MKNQVACLVLFVRCNSRHKNAIRRQWATFTIHIDNKKQQNAYLSITCHGFFRTALTAVLPRVDKNKI